MGNRYEYKSLCVRINGNDTIDAAKATETINFIHKSTTPADLADEDDEEDDDIKLLVLLRTLHVVDSYYSFYLRSIFSEIRKRKRRQHIFLKVEQKKTGVQIFSSEKKWKAPPGQKLK